MVLKAQELDGCLSDSDQRHLAEMGALYERALASFRVLSAGGAPSAVRAEEQNVISLYTEMGHLMQEICRENPALSVYSFLTGEESHAEASRVIAKLRDVRTDRHEFVYYSQRAYEMLFKLAYARGHSGAKNYLVVKTPVSEPVQCYAVHKIPGIDGQIENAVMCVMLRGALLPSMIMSKEIEEYSSHGYVTPFALFRISRSEAKTEADMEYVLNLGDSFFDLPALDGKDLIFADPMNATGGSLAAVLRYLQGQGIRPRSVSCFNVIAALKGALRTVRAFGGCTVYALWMDPVLNEKAYIMPGLGDAGDRLNGADDAECPRNVMQLIADYGADIADLYRSQLRKIERTVLEARR